MKGKKTIREICAEEFNGQAIEILERLISDLKQCKIIAKKMHLKAIIEEYPDFENNFRRKKHTGYTIFKFIYWRTPRG